MPDFLTTPPIPYVPIADKAAEVRLAIDAARLSAANSFGGLQKLAIPGPFATDAEANTFGVPDDNLYYRSDGTVRAASHISLDLAFALDKTLTARTGPTPTFTRSSTGTFVGSNGLIQSAAINVPRFDYDPATGASKGLLIEESRTNLVWNANSTAGSGNLTTPDGSTATNNFGIAPDGTTTTALLSDNSTVYSWGLSLNASTRDAFVANSTVCGSLYIRKKESSDYKGQLSLAFSGGTGGSFTRYSFNYVTGEITFKASLSAINVNAMVFDAGDFWRIAMIATATNGSTAATVTVTPASFNELDVASSALTGDCEIWGNQVEVGLFPTSLIITSGSSAARSADVCSIAGTDFSSFYNQSEGTMFAAIDEFRRGTSYGTFVQISNSANVGANRIKIGPYGPKTGVSSPLELSVFSESVAQYQALPNTLQSKFAAALGYKTDDARGAVEGNLSIADTAPTTNPVGANQMSIGGGAGFGCHIARIQYFRKRLSNAKLQTITAP